MSKMYLYLGRRDKKGVQIITSLLGDQPLPVRVTDVKNLRLPYEMELEITEIVHDNRMMWEPWIENADSYQELRTKLMSRGYSDLPIHCGQLYGSAKIDCIQKANTKNFKPAPTMVQKPRNPR